MKELRDIKLDLIMGNKNSIVDLFNEITESIRILNSDVYNNDGLEFIYWKVIDDKPQWVFYRDAINDKFWCNYFTYWSLFSTKFKLEYEEIQNITKFLMGKELKQETTTPKDVGYINDCSVQEALKKELNTPTDQTQIETWKGPIIVMENALKRWLSEPQMISQVPTYIQEALKREVIDPKLIRVVPELKIEATLKRNIENI